MHNPVARQKTFAFAAAFVHLENPLLIYQTLQEIEGGYDAKSEVERQKRLENVAIIAEECKVKLWKVVRIAG